MPVAMPLHTHAGPGSRAPFQGLADERHEARCRHHRHLLGQGQRDSGPALLLAAALRLQAAHAGDSKWCMRAGGAPAWLAQRARGTGAQAWEVCACMCVLCTRVHVCVFVHACVCVCVCVCAREERAMEDAWACPH